MGIHFIIGTISSNYSYFNYNYQSNSNSKKAKETVKQGFLGTYFWWGAHMLLPKLNT